MNREEYQTLTLSLMSVDAIRQHVNTQLDALYSEIARLIPEEEGRGRHIPSLEEARARIKAACTRQHGNHRTDSHVKRSVSRLKIVGNKK